MKGRSFLTTVLVVVLATSFMVPVAVAQDTTREEAGAQPAGGASLEELQEQLDAGLITEKEFDQLAPTGPGCCAPEDAGGPDDYGYVYIDSDEPGGPAFSWVDISATGTAIPFGYDTAHGPYPIGFAFNFYGTDYIEMWVSSEGWVSTLTATASDYSNDCPLPSTNGQEGLIAPFWDDRGPYAGPYGSGFYESFAPGACPYGGYPGACLVVEWLDMPLYGNAADLQTFEVILFDDHTFLMQILDAGTAAGTSATTGIENQNASIGLTYGCNTAGYLADNLAILWYKAPPAPRFDDSFKLAPPKVESGNVIDYSVVVVNSGDAPAYSAVMTDVIPAGTTYVPDSVTCDTGTCWYEPADDAVYWTGELGPAPPPGAASSKSGELLTPAGGSREPQAALTDLRDARHTVVPGTASTGLVIENFANSWDLSTIGLVYNPATDFVRYAHESSPNPTIYDVDYPVPHNLLGSISLSGLNPGWPVSLDDNDGAAYDVTIDTYLLADFQGDLVNADDNIIEIDPTGTILNAWETGNDLGSNDSYDGSFIETIIDIAVVPGAPTRYFVAAAFDGSVVYEIDLIKTGAWWTPGTWGTITAWPVPDIGDNVGIDYDAEHGVLYHSDWNSTNIVVTDLDGNVLDEFTCDSPAGFNTGVTYVEGKAAPEVWVTDYTSNSTTRCEIVQPPPCGPVTVFYDDFEGGMTNWAMTGLWNDEHETDACGALVAPFPSSDHDAYYGLDGVCTYNNGAANAGELEMVLDVDLTAAQGASLHFWSFEQTECGGGNCGFDERYVDVSTDGGATWATVWGSMGPEGQWYPAEADLSAYVGGPVRVRFRFDSGDFFANDFFGWMVDNVEIVACVNSGANVNFQVVADEAMCGDVVVNEAVIDDPEALGPTVVMAATEVWDSIYLHEDFEGAFPPAGWQVIDNAGTGAVWDRNDAFGQPNQCAYGSGYSAAAHAYGSGLDWDTELWSPPITLPAGSGAVLKYASNFQDYVGNGDIYLDVSTDGGMSWTNLRYQTVDDPAGGTLEFEDLSAFAGETLTLRWVYTATASTAWYWHIDDVQVIDCIPPDMVVDAPPLEAELCPGEMTSIDFSICNDSDGTLPLAWGLSEITGTYTLAPFGPDGIGDAWETMAPLPSARVFNAVIASGPYVYVIGGTSDAGGATPTDTNFRYNTADDTWSTMTPMPAALDSIDGIAIDGSIYIPGSDPDSNTYVYDTAADAWSVIPANGGYVAPVQYQVVAIGTDLYVLGGITGGASTTNVWVLDTTSGTWSAGVPMQNSRTSFSAAAIDGNIYVAGGVLFPGFVPDMTAEMFDGVSWSYIAPVPDGGGAYTRWSYNADGMAPGALWLGAGRRDAGWAVLNHAGYYDVATDTWTDSPTIPVLDQGRVYMEGDVAADNYFYVIGGRDSAGAIVYDNNERLMVYSPVFDIPWLTEVPTSGLLFPSECVTVEVTFDATDMAGGTYTATLGLESNDPDTPFTTLPVTLTVLVPPTIEFTPPALEAPTCPGGVEFLDLEICNVGECTLDWFAVEVSETVELAGSAPFVPAGSAPKGPIPKAPLTDSAPASAPLAVPAAPASPDAVLWDQPLSGVNQSTYANQDFEALFDAYDIFIADDFGNAEWWAIDTLFVVGNTWSPGSDLDCANTLNWHVYADAGGVPAGDPWGGGDPPLWAMSLPTDDPMVSFGTGTGGFQTNVTLTLDFPLYLPPATYWLVFYPSMNYLDCGQAGRQVADTTNGNAAQVINPGGGFGFPTVWTSVQDPSTWGMVQQDLAFRLEGEALPDVPWLSLDPAAGSLEAGECVVPEATLDSTGLLPGDYTANLLLLSNDPFVPIATVPVTFTVWAPAEVVDVSYVATYLVVDFDALVTGDEPLTFAWDFGDGNTSDLEDPTHTYAAEGCYDVIFTVTNDCASDVWSGEVCVEAECEAVDGLAFSWMPETPLVGESVLFVATEPLTGTPPFTYTWDFGDGFGDVGQTANHAFSAAGDYEVTLMVENACGEALIADTVTVEAGVHYIYLPMLYKNG